MKSSPDTDHAAAPRLPRYRRASTPPPMQLTTRDIRVVHWVYEMRFVAREQIQRLEFSPSTASYCKRRLSLLFHNGYLDRKFIPAPGSFGSTKAIYCLAPKGVQLLAHQLKTYVDWRPRDSERELYFLQHTLASNDVRSYVTMAAQRLGLSLEWENERTLRRREMHDYVADPKDQGQKLAIIPDGYLRLSDGHRPQSFALELDRATVEDRPFKAKVRAYGEWKLTGTYRRRFGTDSLRVLFVVARNNRDPHRLRRIKNWCETENGRSLFWFADANDITDASVLTEPIWRIAGRDGLHALLGGDTWSGGMSPRFTNGPSPAGHEPG